MLKFKVFWAEGGHWSLPALPGRSFYNEADDFSSHVPRRSPASSALVCCPLSVLRRPEMSTAPPNISAGRTEMTVSFAGITFKNPVIAAAGTFGYGIEFEDIVTLEKLGGFVTKGLSREPMVGNPPPRLFETAAGMLNSIGLQNIGARAFLDEKLPRLAPKNVVVIANVFGYSREDYVETIRILNEA